MRDRARALVGALVVAAVAVVALVIGAPAGAQPGATTSTLPVDGRTFGDIIPEPNSGRPPETPGDPGGWLQVSLFFLLCITVGLIVLFVWRQSRTARARRKAAGQDPVDVARARGEGTRKV